MTIQYKNDVEVMSLFSLHMLLEENEKDIEETTYNESEEIEQCIRKGIQYFKNLRFVDKEHIIEHIINCFLNGGYMNGLFCTNIFHVVLDFAHDAPSDDLKLVLIHFLAGRNCITITDIDLEIIHEVMNEKEDIFSLLTTKVLHYSQ